MPRLSNVSAGYAILFIYLAVLAQFLDHVKATPCSRECLVEECHTALIKYGKYCGVDYTGCPGEKPCDDLDECCQRHDICVDEFGLTDDLCQGNFTQCMDRVKKSGKEGFSKECPPSTAVRTMIDFMELGYVLKQLNDPTGHSRDITTSTITNSTELPSTNLPPPPAS